MAVFRVALIGRRLVLRICTRRRMIVPEFFLCLVGKLKPVASHREKEDFTVQIGKVLGELHAIGGVKPVAGHDLTIYEHSPVWRLPYEVFAPLVF